MRTVHLIGGVAAIALALGGATLAQSQAVPQPQPRPQALQTQTPQAATSPSVRPVPTRMPIPVSAIFPNTQALFDGYVQQQKMPGIVGAFGHGDGPTFFVTAGRIGLEPGAPAADADSIWRVYSMTKPITAMAAMLLVEDGKLGLDDPLSKYFPAFAKMKVLKDPDTSLETVPATRPITIRELMTHSSGLGYQINAKGPLLKEYERLGLVPFAANGETEATARRTRPTSLAVFAERVAQAPLIAQPGTTWHYSMGLDVLAAVIEKASGEKFETFLRRRLLDPLKMTSTDWQVAPGDIGRFATNYAFAGDRLVPMDPARTSVFLQPPSFPYGGAGLTSSASDYDRFLHMLQDEGTLDGVRVMKPETVRLAMSNLLPPGVTFGGIGKGTGGDMSAKMGFGAGGSVYLADMPGGPSKGTYGWGGAAGTIAFVDPGKRFRGTIMVNYFPGDRWPVREETVKALASDAARLGR